MASGEDSEGDLPVAVNPYRCDECLRSGNSCVFHAGFAAGWDACVLLVAEAVNGHA